MAQIIIVLVMIISSLSASIGRAQTTNYILNAFNSAAEVSKWQYWWGITNYSLSWDSVMDAGGNPNSGSMKVTVAFNQALWVNQGGNQFSFVNYVNGTGINNPVRGTLFTNLEMDVYWGGGSPLNPVSHNYGSIQFGTVNPQYAADYEGNATMTTTGRWTHLSAPFTPANPNLNQVIGLTLYMWAGNSASDSLNGTSTFWVDNITLQGGAAGPSQTGVVVRVSVDAAAARHPISDWIYGTAFASAAQTADLNTSVNRAGGNSETRYNWQINAHNHAADYYFESIADDGSTAASAAGATADQFVADSVAGPSLPMLTVPMIGWAAKLGPNRSILPSYSIAKYGAQTGSDPYLPDAGTGVRLNGSSITNNDPNDANVPANAAFQQSWLQHLTNRWGGAKSGGVWAYLLDNEPSIWQATHRDVHPIGPTMDEIWQKSTNYAAMIKSVDAGALVAGPEEWGWEGYFYSGYDQQYTSLNGYSYYPDRAAHGGQDYLPWLLNQFHQLDTFTGRRLLDIFSVHYYPQGGEFGDDVSTATQLLRNRSTRSLWDPNYVDTSWIGSVVRLIPRLRTWVNTLYPGTKTGITEYNWGAEASINGATAQADILGIFGREGLDLGIRWTAPDPSTPTYKAIKLYRNYDGQKSAFGDTSVSTQTPNPDNLSAFGAVRSKDGALTLMVVNKQLSAATPAVVSVTNFAGATVQAWQLTASNVITQLPGFALHGTSFTNVVPAQSITLFVISPAPSLRLVSLGWQPDGELGFQLTGLGAGSYRIQSSTDLLSWQNWQTGVISSGSLTFATFSTNAPRLFFRALETP